MPFITGGGGGSGAISGVIVSGTAQAGMVPVASSSGLGSWAFPPGFEFGYDQITVGLSITATTEGTATTLITCAAHTFDGGPVIAEVWTANLRPDTTAVGDIARVGLFESGTLINIFALSFTNVITTGLGGSALGHLRFTPSAASHSYTVGAWVTSNANAVFTAGAGGPGNNPPAFVRFTKV